MVGMVIMDGRVGIRARPQVVCGSIAVVVGEEVGAQPIARRPAGSPQRARGLPRMSARARLTTLLAWLADDTTRSRERFTASSAWW